MTYPVFTADEPPAHPDTWPEHEHQQGFAPLKAQPVQGVFGVEKQDGTIKVCREGFGFLTLDNSGELDFLTLTEFEQTYKGGEHVRAALGL